MPQLANPAEFRAVYEYIRAISTLKYSIPHANLAPPRRGRLSI